MNYCDILMQNFLQPFNWLRTAEIYNKRYEIVPYEWLVEQADVLILLFSAKGIDKDNIIRKFYQSYEDVKYTKLPIEVIYIPMDEKLYRMKSSFKHQANWFSVKYDELLITSLKYMYGITCIPRIVVIKANGEIISSNGILDLERYGKNAIITWISPSGMSRVKNKESEKIYHEKWEYMRGPDKCGLPEIYNRKFSPDPLQESSNESIAQEIKDSKSVGIKSKALSDTVPKQDIADKIEESKQVQTGTELNEDIAKEVKSDSKSASIKSMAQVSGTILKEDIAQEAQSVAQISGTELNKDIAQEVEKSKSIAQISGTELNEDVFQEVKESESVDIKSVAQVSGTALNENITQEVEESKSIAQISGTELNEDVVQEVKESDSVANKSMAQDENIGQEVAQVSANASNENIAQELKETKSEAQISGTEIKEE